MGYCNWLAEFAHGSRDQAEDACYPARRLFLLPQGRAARSGRVNLISCLSNPAERLQVKHRRSPACRKRASTARDSGEEFFSSSNRIYPPLVHHTTSIAKLPINVIPVLAIVLVGAPVHIRGVPSFLFRLASDGWVAV